MSPPPSFPSDWSPEDLGPSLEDLFDVSDPDPSELQSTIHDYLSQDTRHHILQVILGHPAHLVSLSEFEYYITKSRATIREQLADLADHHILKRYHHEPNEDVRNLPAAFWGLTELGVALLAEFRLLRGLPVMRAVHDSTEKSETVKHHEAAPHPPLPPGVTEHLDYTAPEEDDEFSSEEDPLADLRDQSLYAEAAPDSPQDQNDTAEGDRSLDELF